MVRLLSYSEVSSALSCEARHDFRYVGQIVGGEALRPKRLAPRLSGGRAWGAAVAALHQGQMSVMALDESLEKDAKKLRELGVYDEDSHRILRSHLLSLLGHYDATTEPLLIEQPERELLVAIPSRTGKRASSKYKLLAYLDGLSYTYRPGELWLVEYKLRDRLWTVEQIGLSRQIRWYAWAFREITGLTPHGVLVDERLNEVPKPPRYNKGKKTKANPDPAPVLSHAKDQMCTLDAYLAACQREGEEPSPEAVEAMGSRVWQHRVPVPFTEGELDEVGLELVSAARKIGELDAGHRYPLRNASPRNCAGCDFKEICTLRGRELQQTIDFNYERTPPKRDRPADTHKEAIAA